MIKNVIVSTSLTPNILMHIFSCLEIEGSFYNSNYGMKHHFTILDEDYEQWEELAKKCLTLGCNEELYAILFQIPSYIPAEDIDMILETYSKISEAIEEGSFDIILTSYPEVFDSLSIYAPIPIFDSHLKKLHESKEIILPIIDFFKEILQGVWDRFYEDYWEKDLSIKLKKRIENLDAIVSPVNLITIWHKHLKIDYPYQEFIAILVEPTTTVATTLLSEKVMISFLTEDIDLYKIIIHEIGRLFILNSNIFNNETLKSLAQTNIDKLSQIVDAICVYFKTKIFKTLTIKDNISDPYNVPSVNEITPVFTQIWESLKEKNIYHAIIETYNKLSPVI